MERRRFVQSAAAATAALCGGSPALAGRACYPVHASMQRCTAGFTNTPEMPAEPCDAHAWAACLAYLMRGFGAKINVAGILARHRMQAACGAPPRDEESTLLSAAGEWADAKGRPFLVQTTRLPRLQAGHVPAHRAGPVLARLSQQPLICGAAGHATILAEVEFEDGPIIHTRLRDMYVLDPLAGGTRRALTEAERTRPFFTLAISLRALAANPV